MSPTSTAAGATDGAIDYVGIVASSDDGDSGVREHAGRLLLNRAIELGALGRGEEAVAAYSEVVLRYGAESVPALRRLVAIALVFKGVTLGVLGRDDEAIAAYDEVVARFRHHPEPDFRARVARAQNYRHCQIHGHR